MDGSEPRICCFDIETTNLKADFGTIICASWLWYPSRKIHTLKIIDYPAFTKRQWDDKALVRDLSKELSKADMFVSWYGKRFDECFINTRLLHHGLPPMPRIPHWDGWRTARFRLALSSNRLANISEFLKLESKTPLRGDVWVKARCGHLPSIRYVVQHCEQDVRVLAQAYERLRPFSESHPHAGIMADRPDGCPTCGKGRLRSHGWETCKTRRYRRFRCLDCGSLCKGRTAEKLPSVKYKPQ